MGDSKLVWVVIAALPLAWGTAAIIAYPLGLNNTPWPALAMLWGIPLGYVVYRIGRQK